jgi:hypothetical protein
MKTTATAASTAAAPQRRRPARESTPGPRRGHKAAQERAQQKNGAYKRVELFLGLEAAIALRHLMRDGRSAREVIEALLRDEKQRRQERG